MYERCVWRYFTVIRRHRGRYRKRTVLGYRLTVDDVLSEGEVEVEVDAKPI
jgi:hypothetical protein